MEARKFFWTGTYIYRRDFIKYKINLYDSNNIKSPYSDNYLLLIMEWTHKENISKEQLSDH
jgi:hypothetical protein